MKETASAILEEIDKKQMESGDLSIRWLEEDLDRSINDLIERSK